MIKDYFNLSYTFLRKRGLRSWLTIVGVFIGIAAVVSLIGLGEGLKFAVVSQFNFLSTDILTVQATGTGFGPPGEGVVEPLSEKHLRGVERLSGVEMVIGRNIENAKIEFNERSDFTFAASIPEREKRKELERIAQLELGRGRMLRDSDENKVVLGSNYGESDRFGKAVRPRDNVKVQGKDFEVVGLLKKKGNFIIDNAILMNDPVVAKLFDVNDTHDVLLIKVANVEDMALVKSRVEKFMRKERDVDEGEEDFTVESPEQSLKDLESTLFAVQMFIYVIASISIVVGGIGIANTMYTSVVERTKQIGIMKSIGARRSNIFTIFLIESGLLGMVGGVLGILFGVAIAYGLTFIGRAVLGTELIAVQISPQLLLGALLFSFLIGSIAGFLPAWQASKLKPVDALRYAK